MNFAGMTDQDLLDVIGRQMVAGIVAPSPGDKMLAAMELQRRRLEDLTESSTRLESLTKWLIGITVVLGFLTLVLAVPEIRNLVAWLKAR